MTKIKSKLIDKTIRIIYFLFKE